MNELKARSREIKIFSGNANPALAKEICEDMNIPLGNALVGRFSDGEINVQIVDNVRGMDVFVVQPTGNPVNRNLMELLIMIDALKRASATRITAVLPYYGYSRQDRKVQPRVPITSKLVADLITTAGANRVLTVDLHAGQIQGFFNIPVDELTGLYLLAEYFELRLQVFFLKADKLGVYFGKFLRTFVDAGFEVVVKCFEVILGNAQFLFGFNTVGDVAYHNESRRMTVKIGGAAVEFYIDDGPIFTNNLAAIKCLKLIASHAPFVNIYHF